MLADPFPQPSRRQACLFTSFTPLSSSSSSDAARPSTARCRHSASGGRTDGCFTAKNKYRFATSERQTLIWCFPKLHRKVLTCLAAGVFRVNRGVAGVVPSVGHNNNLHTKLLFFLLDILLRQQKISNNKKSEMHIIQEKILENQEKSKNGVILLWWRILRGCICLLEKPYREWLLTLSLV